MKKKMNMFLVIAILCAGLVGCTKQGKCEDCGKETTLYHYKSTITIMDKETKIDGWFCKKCCEDNAEVCDSLNESLPGSATYSY